jgi:hypothetical protein
MYEDGDTSPCKILSGAATVHSPGPTTYWYHNFYSLVLRDKTYKLDILLESPNSTDLVQAEDPKLPIFRFLGVSITDFAVAEGEFQSLTAVLASQPVSKPSGTLSSPGLAPAKLLVSSDPENAQVYINAQLKGTASANGLAEELPPGTYLVRATFPGYKDFAESVTLSEGENSKVFAHLERLEPAPFSVGDITELLKGGVSPKRVAVLVQQRGVSFLLDNDSERKIRDAGGDTDLLLAIAKAKK